MPPIPNINESAFTLDVSGITGFLGGDQAVSAMESLLYYKYGKYMGWCNAPGSYNVAKRFGMLARSKLWDDLYPGDNLEPEVFLKMDGKVGPMYRGAITGMMKPSGHIGHMLAQICRDDLVAKEVKGDEGNPTVVTVVDLRAIKSHRATPYDTLIPIEYPATFSSHPLRYMVVIGSMIFSIGASIVCGLLEDWFALSLILLGVVCNGIACYIIGSAKMYLKPARQFPSPHHGNGIMDDGNDFIVLRGDGNAVNYVVSAKFVVKYGNDNAYDGMGISAIVLTIQFVAQLFLVPQCVLLGQVLFLATLAISWMGHAALSRIDRKELQKSMLRSYLPFKEKEVGRKYLMPNRTSAVVFATLCALPLDELKDPAERMEFIQNILVSLLPRSTPDWREWRDLVTKKIGELADVPVEEWRSQATFHEQSHNGLLGDWLRCADLGIMTFWKERRKIGRRTSDRWDSISSSTFDDSKYDI